MRIAISAVRKSSIGIQRAELIKNLQSLNHDVFYIGQKGNSIHPDFIKHGIEFLSIPMARSNTNPLKEIKTIRETVKVLKENKIDTLIAYGIRTFPTIVIAAKIAGIKNVLCIVNGSGRLFQLDGMKGFLVKLISYPMLCLAFLKADNILFQNPDDLLMVKRKGLLWKKNYGTIDGSGVNIEKFNNSPLENNAVFSMISRLTGTKGVNEYVQAARQVKRRYPKAIFHLIGPMDNEDRSINKEELQKAIDDGIIIKRGKVDDVRPHIKQCRIFVLPSYYPEGIPRSILEAMAMGRPILTTDSPGCRETVIDGVNGFLTQPRDVNTLAEKMIWMIENEEKVIEMGKQSRLICEGKFDVNKVNKEMLMRIKVT